MVNTEKAFNQYSIDNDMDALLQDLKELGLSQMECTKELITNLKLPLKDADNLVVNSIAWRDNFDEVKKLRESFFDMLNNSADI